MKKKFPRLFYLCQLTNERALNIIQLIIIYIMKVKKNY